MQTLTKEVENILAQSGWHIDRQVDITEIENFLKSKGYSLSPFVIKALQEFGGIEYTFRHPDGSIESFHFSPEEAMGDYYDREDFEEYEVHTKESLVVIGEAYRGNLILLMSETGKVFGENGGLLFKFGDHIYEAINNLCLF